MFINIYKYFVNVYNYLTTNFRMVVGRGTFLKVALSRVLIGKDIVPSMYLFALLKNVGKILITKRLVVVF